MKSYMAKLIALSSILLMIFTGKINAQSSDNKHGSLLIICEEGFRVYMDDELKGFTNKEQDGLFIQNIDAGPHTITIKKSGLKDYTFTVNIESGRTAEHAYSKQLQSEDNDSKALVYIFRPGRMRGAWVPYTVHVDDQIISEAKLGNKTYLKVRVKPGEHVFWHALYGHREEVTIDCKAGETYYIRAKTDRFYLSTKEEWEKERKNLSRRN